MKTSLALVWSDDGSFERIRAGDDLGDELHRRQSQPEILVNFVNAQGQPRSAVCVRKLVGNLVGDEEQAEGPVVDNRGNRRLRGDAFRRVGLSHRNRDGQTLMTSADLGGLDDWGHSREETHVIG